MKPFVFKLETLLSIRRRREDAAKIVLSQARGRLKAARDFLDELRERQTAAWAEFRAKQERGEIIVLEFQSWYRFLDLLRKEINRQEEVVEQLAREMLLALRALEKAMKERKAVEKLRERRFDQYRLELQLEEQKAFDEIAIARYRSLER
jgi:flagellar FliJ protein